VRRLSHSGCRNAVSQSESRHSKPRNLGTTNGFVLLWLQLARVSWGVQMGSFGFVFWHRPAFLTAPVRKNGFVW